MARYYPLYFDVQDRLCLIVGGGPVAERKARALREAGAKIRIVSPTLTPELRALADSSEIEAVLTPYAPACLEGAFLAIAATDRREVNAQVAADAKARGLPVNVADAPDEGDFITPTVIRRGELVISLTTGGGSPLLAARLAAELGARFGPEYADLVELLGRMRDTIKEQAADAARRRSALERLVEAEAELRDLLRAGRADEAETLARRLVETALQPGG